MDFTVTPPACFQLLQAPLLPIVAKEEGNDSHLLPGVTTPATAEPPIKDYLQLLTISYTIN
jgi:hypothetical protein